MPVIRVNVRRLAGSQTVRAQQADPSMAFGDPRNTLAVQGRSKEENWNLHDLN